MRVPLTTAALALTAVCLSGCWSDEDLLFPHNLDAETVHLKIPGVQFLEDRGAALTQGLNDPCVQDKDTITCQTRAVAGMFNTITFKLIEVVNVVMNTRPTKKQAGLRVWGPFYEAGKDHTVRFEMRRDDTVGDGGFKYCVHLKPGRHDGFFADRGVSCGSDDGGFVEVFSGTLVPGDPNRPTDVAVSKGTMDLNMSKARANGVSDKPTDQGHFKFIYDTTGGQQTISINISDVVDDTTGLPASADYSYHRAAAGDGVMTLVLKGVNQLDELDLLARWNSDEATRVDAKGTNFTPVTLTYQGWECSDANLNFVTRHYEWDPARDLPASGPSEVLCPTGLPDRPAGW